MSTPRTRHAATIDAVLVLLDGGREAMARTLLARLAVDVAAEMRRAAAEAYEAGYEAGRAALAAEIVGDAKPRRPAKVAGRERGSEIAGPPDVGSSPQAAQRKQPRLVWLAERVRDQQLRRLVLDVLKVDERHLDGVLEGRAQLSGSQWRRLRSELGE
jgi:hypothetical protein